MSTVHDDRDDYMRRQEAEHEVIRMRVPVTPAQHAAIVERVSGPRYVSPYGRPTGLQRRLAEWVNRLGTDRALPWPGLGLIRDLELVVQLLNLTEFAEWLRVNGTPEQAAFADDILADQFTLEAVRTAVDTAGMREIDDPVKAVELLDEQARESDAVRAVLVEVGALASADDRDMPLDALLRALLS